MNYPQKWTNSPAWTPPSRRPHGKDGRQRHGTQVEQQTGTYAFPPAGFGLSIASATHPASINCSVLGLTHYLNLLWWLIENGRSDENCNSWFCRAISVFTVFFYLLLRYNGVLVNGTLHWVTAEWQVFFPSPTPFPSPYSSCPLRSRAFAWNNACLALCFYSTFLRFHLLFVYVLSPWFGLCPFKMLLQWRLLGLYYNYRLLAQRKTTLSLSIYPSVYLIPIILSLSLCLYFIPVPLSFSSCPYLSLSLSVFLFPLPVSAGPVHKKRLQKPLTFPWRDDVTALWRYNDLFDFCFHVILVSGIDSYNFSLLLFSPFFNAIFGLKNQSLVVRDY